MGSQDGRIRGDGITPPFTSKAMGEGGPTTLTMWGNHVSAAVLGWSSKQTFPTFPAKNPTEVTATGNAESCGRKTTHGLYRWFEVHPWKINGWNPKSWRWMVPVISGCQWGGFLGFQGCFPFSSPHTWEVTIQTPLPLISGGVFTIPKRVLPNRRIAKGGFLEISRKKLAGFSFTTRQTRPPGALGDWTWDKSGSLDSLAGNSSGVGNFHTENCVWVFSRRSQKP